MRALFYGFRRVFLFDLVVEEGGRVGRGHEAAVDLGIDADVLVDLAIGELHFQRLRALVVADRAQLRRIDALSLHQAFSTLILSPDLTFFRALKFSIFPMMLQAFASFGRSSVEI